MNTKYIEEFIEFSKELNVTSVAKKLFITRSTLRDHLSRLEKDLGVQLIAKEGSDKVVLTPLGKRFAVDARELMDKVDCVVDTYAQLRDNFVRMRVGSVGFVWLEPAIYQARKSIIDDFPNKEIEIVSVDRPHTFKSLEAGEVDIVVASLKKDLADQVIPDDLFGPEVSAVKVCEDETMLLVGEGHPLYDKDELRAADLKDVTIVLPKDVGEWWVRDGILHKIEQAGGSATIDGKVFSDAKTYFASDFDQVLGGVSGRHIACNEVKSRGMCKAVPLVDVSLISSFYALCRKEFLQNETAALFHKRLGAISAQVTT